MYVNKSEIFIDILSIIIVLLIDIKKSILLYFLLIYAVYALLIEWKEGLRMSLTPEWLTAIATIVLVIATMIYVYFSYKLTQETVKLRKVETSPFITVKIEPYNYSHMLKLEIENIGKSPAYDVDISFSDKTSRVFEDKEYTLPETHINYLPIGQKVTTLIGMVSELQDKIDEFEIELKYKSKDKIVFNESIKINYKFMLKIHMLLAEPQEIKQLEAIKNEISKINQTLKDKLH